VTRVVLALAVGALLASLGYYVALSSRIHADLQRQAG
jgi:hypothetical protein